MYLHAEGMMQRKTEGQKVLLICKMNQKIDKEYLDVTQLIDIK